MSQSFLLQVLTFPEVLIPLARDAYTMTHARNKQKASGHLISPGYSMPAEIFSTKYLRTWKEREGEGRKTWKETDRQTDRCRSAGFISQQSQEP